MHGRHRSPADRSAPAGAGAVHSGYRSFGRGGGSRRSGQPKSSSYGTPPPPPPPPPPRRPADVLLEAGRLAAEYLVAKGLLPASLLPPPAAVGRSWTNGDGGGESGRTSALSRLGRRRFEDDEVGFEARNQKGRGGRRRHRNGSYGRHGSEWGRENGRGGPWTDTWTERGRGYGDAMDGEDFDRPSLRWTERGRGFLDTVDGEDLDRGGELEEDTGRGVVGGEVSKAATKDELSMSSKSGVAGESESEQESDKSADNNGSKTMKDSEDKKDPVPEAEDNLNRKTEHVRVLDLEMEEAEKVRDTVENVASGVAEMNKCLQEEVGSLSAQPCPATEEKQSSSHGINLLSLCDFAKVPTKPRSSIANKSLKTDLISSSEEVKDSNDDSFTRGELGAKTEEAPTTVSPSTETLTDQPQSSRSLASEISTVNASGDSFIGQPQNSRSPVRKISRSLSAPLGEESVGDDLMSSLESRCIRSKSFRDSSYVHQQPEASQGPPGFALPGKLLDTGIDEGFAEDVKREGMKRQREWSSSLLSETGEYFRNLRAKPSNPPAEKHFPDDQMVDSVEDEQLREADAFCKVEVDSGDKLEKERQLASSSFKICDLNLMEAPEVTDIPDDPVLEHMPTSSVPLISGNNLSMDFGLSIGQRCNDTDGYGHCSTVDKVVQVIDVEDDSPVQVITCDTSKTEALPVYPNLENFLNHPENPVDLPDIQDGYGLAISDFLGNDISGCSAVQGDIGNLQGGMPFHGAEGITGEDDSLYVTLGEIPMGFMDVWDQPPPEYGKFF